MAQLNGIVRGNINDVATKETINENTAYNFQDIQSISLTNEQMTNARTTAQNGFFKKDSIWYCTDSGTYTKDHFYQFTITGTSPIDNVASWTDLGALGGSPAENIIDIGEGQTTIGGTVYPTISKSDADEIYQAYVSGKNVTILWGSLGIATHFSPIYASDISGYEMDCIIHGKVVTYNWTNSTTGDITPTVA